MLRHLAPPGPKENFELDVFCAQSGDAWRVYVRRFDRHGEACPVYLDIEDLDYQMSSSGVTYEKRPCIAGGVQLVARGHAATVLAVWLSQCFASDQRHRPESGDEPSGLAD